MKKTTVVLCIITITAIMGGCIDKEQLLEPNKTRMSDIELINNFCQSQGYSTGITESQSPYGFYEYKKSHGGIGGFDYDKFNRQIICSRTDTWDTIVLYDYNDLYKWTKNI